MQALLEVRDLTVHFRLDRAKEFAAVRSASFQLCSGEVLGLLGESGCGKTTLALSLLRLLPSNGRIVQGSVRFEGRDLGTSSEADLEKVRGAAISIVFQEPGQALSPVMRVGDQIARVIRVHQGWNWRRCRDEAEFMLTQVHLDHGGRVYDAYPHQLSGGQLQRVVIAQALACRPSVVIADEPTASLDTTIQAEILALLKEVKEQFKTALFVISHNPGVLAALADRLLVMYAGQIVETGTRDAVFRNPLHPFTRGLLRSFPRPVAGPGSSREKKLPCIGGSPPDMTAMPPGCPFEPRCPDRMEICSSREPNEVSPEESRFVRCFKYGG